MVIIVEGNKEEKPLLSNEEIISLLKKEIRNGLSKKDAIKKVCKDHSLKKNDVYDLANAL